MGNSGAPNEVHVNDGFGTFTAMPDTSISQPTSDTRAIAVLDIDNDGDVRERPRALNQHRRQRHHRAYASARCPREI